MLERVWGKGNPLTLLVGIQNSTATMENSVEIPKKLEIELPYDPAILLMDINTPRKSESNRHVYPNVYHSTVNNSQGMEAT